MGLAGRKGAMAQKHSDILLTSSSEAGKYIHADTCAKGRRERVKKPTLGSPEAQEHVKLHIFCGTAWAPTYILLHREEEHTDSGGLDF